MIHSYRELFGAILRITNSTELGTLSYKLEDVLMAYGLEESVSHRALEDAKLTNILAIKVNEFAKMLKGKL